MSGLTSGKNLQPPRQPHADKRKRPLWVQRAFRSRTIVLGRSSDRLELAVRSLTGNAMDVRTVDAEIVQFAVGHTAEFRDGLTILAPVIERAREVHIKPLSEGFICQQPPIGADFYLMTRIYAATRKTKTAKFSDHLCE